VQSYATTLEQIRNQKREGAFKVREHLETAGNTRPKTSGSTRGATSAGTNATVIFASSKSSMGGGKYQTDMHSGIWSYNKIEKRNMWSDTGSFDYAGKGDIVKVHNTYAANMANPTD